MKKLKIILFIMSLTYIGSIQAQESINTSGGNATGSGGKLAYSIGQITFHQNSSGIISVSSGIQQPFEVSQVLGVENTESIKLHITTFPNPVTNYLTLSFGEKNSTVISYQLFDVNGKLLQSKSDLQNKETVPMQKFNSGIYFLKVSENDIVKTFKIIKN